jgi:hypothetical protein
MLFRRLLVLAAAVAAFAAPALPARAAQDLTMPSCAAGDPVVWVNTKSKVYHVQGSAVYANRTKNGKYACTSDAQKMGARAAKESMKKGITPAATPSTAAPAADATPMSTKHRKARKGTMTPTPAPEAT